MEFFKLYFWTILIQFEPTLSNLGKYDKYLKKSANDWIWKRVDKTFFKAWKQWDSEKESLRTSSETRGQKLLGNKIDNYLTNLNSVQSQRSDFDFRLGTGFVHISFINWKTLKLWSSVISI